MSDLAMMVLLFLLHYLSFLRFRRLPSFSVVRSRFFCFGYKRGRGSGGTFTAVHWVDSVSYALAKQRGATVHCKAAAFILVRRMTLQKQNNDHAFF